MAVASNKIDEIFWHALQLPDGETRQTYVNEACGSDSELQRLVEKLLQAQPQVEQFLEQPLGMEAAAASSISALPGTRIGPYKLLQQIGEGGFGVVYMAEQQVPVRRKVALKIIKPGMDTKEVIARFESERQALALMDHPNIAKVLDAGTTGGEEPGTRGQEPAVRASLAPGSRPLAPNARPYFVMELVKGVPITDYCDSNHLPTEDRLELFIQVCNALQHAHQKGIIHRDLKPSNVMVTMHDGRPVPKVIDFGVAKATSQTLTERTLFTAYGQMIGTPAYMSPEQAEMSDLDVDTRSDVYALGVLLYELLTGTTPFEAKRLREAGFAEMQRIIREEEPESVSTRIARIAKTRIAELGARSDGAAVPRSPLAAPRSTELDWIVARSLEKDRERRYESASSFARDIRRYLSDEPVQACPPSTLYRFRKFARRNKRTLATLAITGAALLASVAALTVAYLQVTVAYREVNQKQQQTQAALDRERQTLYYNRIALADSSYWLANDVGQAERLLDECPQALRHWEWHYLKRLCHADVLTLPHPGTNAPALAYSKDRRRLATGGQSAVTIWDPQTGAKLLSCRGQAGVVSSLAFSPDGKQLAAASDDQTVKLWDAETGAEIRTFSGHKGPVRSVAFSPAGGVLASAGQDQTVKLWDVTTGDEIASLKGHTGPLRAVAFSQDGQRLASASEDSTVRVWDIQARQELLTLRGHKSYVHCVAFHPEGKLLASGGHDWTTRIWDLATGQEVRTLAGHKHYVSGVDFSQDGRQLATSSYDQTIKLWDVASGQEVNTLRGHTHWVQQVAFGTGGTLASASHDHTVKIWDSAASQEARTISMPHGEVHHVAFSPAGQRLATAGGDNNVRIWDVATRRELLVLTGHTWRVWGVAFSPDGQKLASAGGRQGDSDPADVKIWDTATGSELLTLHGHTRTVKKVAFSPDGRRLASASHDHTVKLWDVTTGRELITIPAHTKEVIGVAFSQSGQQFATSSRDATVKLWDVASGRLVRTFASHNSPVYDVAFSPDGQRLASVGSALPSCLKVWNVATGDEIYSLPVRTTSLHGLAFSPDGRRIATVSYEGTAKIWDAQTGHDILTLRGHTDVVWGAAFSPDGRRLATASYDGTAKIWDATPLPDP